MSKQKNVQEYGYIKGLDGWRGIVSLLVVVYHFYYFFSDNFYTRGAYLGVDFFFIMSGFIICRRYELPIAKREIDFKEFGIRRLARLYPIYILSIVLFVLVNHYIVEPVTRPNYALNTGFGPYMSYDAILQLFMIGNIAGMPMPWNGPAWSISVEWVVNLLFFLLVSRLRVVPTALWAIIALFSLTYLMDASPDSINQVLALQPFFNTTIARGLLGFSIGVLLCRFHRFLPSASKERIRRVDAILILVAGTSIVFGSSLSTFIPFAFDYIMVTLLFPALIAITLYPDSIFAKITSARPLQLLGKLSYSIYLLHLSIGFVFQYSEFIQSLAMPRPMFGLVYMCCVLGISALSYFYFERPLRTIILTRLLARRYGQ